MSHDTLYRIRVRAAMSLRPGWLRVEPLPLEPAPGLVRLGRDYPNEMMLDMLPPELRVIGSTFWLVFDVYHQPVGFEHLGSAT